MNNIQPIENFTILGKGNAFLDVLSDGFSEKVVLPTIKKTYNLVGEMIAVPVGLLSISLEKRIRTLLIDPISSDLALKITRPVEDLTLFIGRRKPINLPVLRYLDACVISSAQSLHRFTKEVNYLLLIPQTLKRMVKGISLGKVIDSGLVVVGKKWSWIEAGMVQIKEAVLCFLATILKVIDKVLSFFLMEKEFGILGYIRQIVHIARTKTHARFSEVANQTIEMQEREIRKIVTANIAQGSIWWVTTTFNRIILKTGLGAFAYIAGKNYLESSHNIPATLVHLVALPIIGKLVWDNAFLPVLDPFFHNYRSEYDGKGSYLKSFLKYYGLDHHFIPLWASREIMHIAQG